MRTMLTMGALCLLVGMADAQEVAFRFQIVTNANDTFLLDTATGNVWHLTQYPDFNKDPLAWVPMFRLNMPSDTTPLLSAADRRHQAPYRAWMGARAEA